jgi:hypothetical protein
MKIWGMVGLAALVLALAPVAARADIIMDVSYYTIGESDQDMGDLGSGVYNNEVQSQLGSNGLPVLNTSTYGCTSGCFTDSPFPADVTSDGQITWWSPSLNNGGAGGASDVTLDSTGTVDLGPTNSYSNGNFYPPNGTGPDDASGFQAAVFSTVLDVPEEESIAFTIGADDVAFLYLNGQIACDLGGVHGDSPGTCTSGILQPGDNTLEIFYADLEQTGAALTFSVNTEGITGAPAPVPEPGTLPLLGAGLFALSFVRRRFQRR